VTEPEVELLVVRGPLGPPQPLPATQPSNAPTTARGRPILNGVTPPPPVAKPDLWGL
jgi:hypothetical protein